jgi:hypothetical protein
MQRLEVSGAVRHIYMSLGGKGLIYILIHYNYILSSNIITYNIHILIIFSGSAAQHGLWASSSRGFAPQSIGLLWTSDQPVPETSTWQHTTDKHPCPFGIWTHSLKRRAAVDLRLRPRGHWDRPYIRFIYNILIWHIIYIISEYIIIILFLQI